MDTNPLAIANAYASRHGLGRIQPVESKSLDERIAMELADFYDARIHDPTNPIVTRSYNQFKNEVLMQWNWARQHGIIFQPVSTDPYPNSASMMEDVIRNHRLRVYTGGNLPRDHPLQQIAPNGLSYNIIFRGVHDLFGHAAHGNSFGPQGEYRAFLAHSQMFSPLAVGALAQETLSQNSWFNFGKHLRVNGRVPRRGEQGYIEPRDRPFAPQKANVYWWER